MAGSFRTSLSLEVSRRFAAPPERVFDAWISGDIARWLPPPLTAYEVERLEPWVGGSFEVRITLPLHRPETIFGVLLEVARPERLVFTLTGTYNDQETMVTVTFVPDGGGAMVTLRHAGFAESTVDPAWDARRRGEGGPARKRAAIAPEDPPAGPAPELAARLETPPRSPAHGR